MERLTNMIKALRCVASQNVEGDCYADIQNYMHITDDKFKRLVCRDGENLKDFINGKEAVTCPFYQKEYGCSFEDGELFWINNVADLLEKLEEYQHLEEQGRLIRLPCKVGDTVYFLGSKCDKCEEDDCYGCPYNFNGEKRDDRFVYDMVVKQFRIRNNSAYIVDNDTVWSSSEISLNIDQFGKTVFLTQAEAEQRLKEMESD